MNVTLDDLLKIIGSKEVEILAIKSALADAQKRIKELEAKAEAEQ